MYKSSIKMNEALFSGGIQMAPHLDRASHADICANGDR